MAYPGGRPARVSVRPIACPRLAFSKNAHRIGAFTLSELIVAVGILALMMALAGQVFSITVRSTGQATALTQVNQRLRLIEQTLREDLAHVRSDSSLLVVQGNPVKAYWTASGRDADDGAKDPTDGYPHLADPEREMDDGNGNVILTPPRADVLMFVTQRTGVRSVVFPDVTANAQQVVYGHALLTDYVTDSSKPAGWRSVIDFETNTIEEVTGNQFPLDSDDNQDPPTTTPASAWHLARRTLLLTGEEVPPKTPDGKEWATSQLFDEAFDENGDYPLLAGLIDVVGAFDFDAQVLVPAPLPPEKVEAPPWIFQAPYNDYKNTTDYDRRRQWMRRSVVDSTLPAPIADRIGHYMLPQCASFKVEWTLDPAILGGGDRVIWFDSDDSEKQTGEKNVYKTIRREMDRLEILFNQEGLEPKERDRYYRRKDQLERLINSTDSVLYGDRRFPPGDNGQYLEEVPGLFWFPKVVPLKVPPPGPQRRSDGVTLVTQRDEVFPFALRITVDVFDDNLRLDRPIRHVMVIPLGA